MTKTKATDRPHLGPLLDAQALVTIDVDRLLETRALVQANSGAGKTWLLRRLLEQTHGRCQQLVIDPEGEMHTLREKFDYVLAASGGDCRAEPKSAAMLARRLLELGVSAIIDIYDLGAQRARFVQLFLESLMSAPKDLWHPTMVVIDEADIFAPEKGQGESVSSAAVVDLMARGRKRGFGGVLATQRISRLDKNAAAECNNRLIGRTSLDLDQKRAGAALGFTTRDQLTRLARLDDGHFYVFGPALSREVVEITVGPTVTSHARAGTRGAPPTPPRERVRQILAQLADLPQEAEEEAKTVAELRAQVKKLQTLLNSAENPMEAGPTKLQANLEANLDTLQRVNAQLREALAARVASYSVLSNAIVAIQTMAEEASQAARMETWPVPPAEPSRQASEKELAYNRARARAGDDARELARRSADLKDLARNGDPTDRVLATGELARRAEAKLPGPRMVRRMGSFGPEVVRADGIVMSKLERTLLTCLVQRGAPLTRKKILTLTGYRGSGTISIAFARMLREGWIENVGNDLAITSAGTSALGDYERLPTGGDLREALLHGESGRLNKLERKLLDAICVAYPLSTTRKAVLESTGYKGSGNISIAFAKLITLGYVDKQGGGVIVASKELF